jgi:hypothetical protein
MYAILAFSAASGVVNVPIVLLTLPILALTKYRVSPAEFVIIS